MTKPLLMLVHSETGEIQEHGSCPRCAQAEAEAETWEQEVLKLKRQIKRMQADKETERREYAARATIQDVFDEWGTLTGHANSKLTPDRFDGIRRMLEADYTREHFTWLNHGLAAFPYQRYSTRFAEKVPNSERRDDVAYACKTGERFEKIAALGRRCIEPAVSVDSSEEPPRCANSRGHGTHESES